MRYLLLPILLLGLAITPRFAHAQAAPGKVTSSCGSSSLTAGNPSYLYLDTTGLLCNSSSGGGSSGVSPVGYANQTNTPAVTVTGSSTSVVSARTGAVGTGRGLLILVNTTANAAWCTSGTASVNSGTFLAGTVGASINLPFTGAESCIAVSTSAIVSVTELY